MRAGPGAALLRDMCVRALRAVSGAVISAGLIWVPEPPAWPSALPGARNGARTGGPDGGSGDGPGDGPPPGHPERLCPDVPLTDGERALERELTAAD